jgi:pyruvate dehydrogenase E2 component (dihydrolipoamide acetyltransferase)
VGEFKMPSLGADMQFGTLTEWLVELGAQVKRGDLIAVVETDKGDIEVEVWEDGVVSQLLVEPGDEVPVDAVMAVINGRPPVAKQAPPAAPKRIRATPVARKMASSLGLDLAQLTGTGPGGAIQKCDVEKAAEAKSPVPSAVPPKAEKPATPVVKEVPPEPASAAVQKKPKADPTVSIRKAIAAAMSRSNREIPHYYLKTRIDLKAATQWLEDHNRDKPVRKRLLLVALLARATVKALARVPELNAFWQNEQSEPQESINLGMAISLRAGGVMTPAILDAQNKSLPGLMESVSDLIDRTRRNQLRASEMNSATITLTNLGDRGVEEVFGVIYPPQVALIGFGKVTDQPWAEDGMLGIRPVVTATVAGDHRATDGRVGARLLELIDKNLQKPEKL